MSSFFSAGIGFAGVVVALASTIPAHASEPVSLSGRAMGTTWSVKYVQPAAPLGRDVVHRQVTDRLEHLEQLFSTYRSHSVLSQFNAASHTDWVPVAKEIAEVAGVSREISELTSGAYDVTVFPLVRLWGFAAQRRSGPLPAPTEIATARALVDWRRLEVRLNPPALRKGQPKLSVDFSSMAKGFTADSVSGLLAELGARNHFVQIGGDIKTGGAPAHAAGWRAAIAQPTEGATGIADVVTLAGHALSTSGDYRNFFRAGPRRYSHLIDPRTGEPASTALAAVSVVDASCARSSAMATALFVLGPEEGFRLAAQEGFACLFLVRRGNDVVQLPTPAFQKLR